MKWFRWHRGCCENPKFAVVAARASKETDFGEGERLRGAVSLTDVIAVWAVILEDAANKNHWGILKKDAEFIAIVLRWHNEEVQNVMDALISEGLLDPTDGGIKISKWEEYQYASDSDPTNAVRQKRYYNAHKRKPNALVKRPDTDTDTDIDIDKKKRGHPRKGIKTRIADDWLPKSESVSEAKKLGFSEFEVHREGKKFKNHARQNEREAIRWDAAFDNWMIKAAEFSNKQPPQEKIELFPALPESPQFAAWRTYWTDNNNPVMLRELRQRELEGRAFKFASEWPPGFKMETAQ